MALLPASDGELWYHLAIFAAVWAALFWTMTTGAIAFVPTGLDGVGDIGLPHVFVAENLVLAMSFSLTESVCLVKLSHDP
jgi:hypothetical protein